MEIQKFRNILPSHHLHDEGVTNVFFIYHTNQTSFRHYMSFGTFIIITAMVVLSSYSLGGIRNHPKQIAMEINHIPNESSRAAPNDHFTGCDHKREDRTPPTSKGHGSG